MLLQATLQCMRSTDYFCNVISFFVIQVQQPFDPATSYYTSMYRPTAADGDGRFSPFFAPATKYSGNVAVLPTHTSQTPQEVRYSNNIYIILSYIFETLSEILMLQYFFCIY